MGFVCFVLGKESLTSSSFSGLATKCRPRTEIPRSLESPM